MISNELIRNLGLTMAAVVSVTLILISDLVTVFWVFTCIAFTLIDLLGLMYYWGLTVEISSSIIVILAAGLAIDYSAHIGHTFTTVRGSKSSELNPTNAIYEPCLKGHLALRNFWGIFIWPPVCLILMLTKKLKLLWLLPAIKNSINLLLLPCFFCGAISHHFCYCATARAKVTLTRMGPAVWNGGFSTFLAFVLLVNTDSHIFTTFFKVTLSSSEF